MKTVYGRGGEQDDDLVPDRPVVEHAEHVREAEDREEVAQARAGLCHLQLVGAQIDHVAFEKDRDADDLDEPDAEFGGDELQVDGQLPVDELRQRQHVDKVQNPGPEQEPARPAEAQEDQSADPDDEGVGDDIGDAGEVAEDRDGHGQQDDREAGPADLDAVVGRHAAHLAQEHVERQERDDRPMAVFGGGPGVAEADKADPEEGDGRCHEQHEPQPAVMVLGESTGETVGGLCLL